MATKAETILSRLQALGYGRDTESSQLVLLNMVHKRVLNARRWRFLLNTNKTLNAPLGDGTIALGSIEQIDAVRVETATSTPELTHIDLQQMRDYEHQFRDQGVPQYWAVEGNELHLWPIPDQTYTIIIDTVENPVELNAGTTNVQVPDSHADILVWATIMAITFRERDWDGHNFARQMYAENFTEMLSQYGVSDRQTPKTVVESGWYDEYEPENGIWPTFA